MHAVVLECASFALIVAICGLFPLAARPTADRVNAVQIEISDASIAKRYIEPEIVSTLMAAVGIGAIIIGAIAMLYALPAEVPALATLSRKATAIMYATAFAYMSSQLLQSITLLPRPDFIARCAPIGYMSPAVYTVGQLCTGDDDLIADGLRNFPSSHATISTATATIRWLLSAALVYETPLDPFSHLSLLLFNSVVVAFTLLIAASRVYDHRHDYVSVVTGVILGYITGYSVHLLYYLRGFVDRRHC